MRVAVVVAIWMIALGWLPFTWWRTRRRLAHEFEKYRAKKLAEFDAELAKMDRQRGES